MFLDVAKDQINAFSDLRVQYKLRKLGREYFYIDWDIENKDNLTQYRHMMMALRL